MTNVAKSSIESVSLNSLYALSKLIKQTSWQDWPYPDNQSACAFVVTVVEREDIYCRAYLSHQYGRLDDLNK